MSQEELTINQDFTMLDDEMLDAIGDAVAVSESRGWHNIGKVAIGMERFGKWENKTFIPLTKEQFIKVPGGQQAWDFVFSIDVKELRPDALYDYRRRVSFNSPDWHSILVPSFEEVLGVGSMAAKDQAYKATLRKLQDAYIDLVDVPQAPQKGKVPTNPNTGKPYMTCKLVKVFASKDEAQKAVDERRKVASDNGASPALDLSNIPAGWIKGDAVKDAASVQTLYQQIKKQYDEGKAPANIARKLSLVNKDDGTPMPNKDGNPVNVAELFGAALDLPAAMFESELA